LKKILSTRLNEQYELENFDGKTITEVKLDLVGDALKGEFRMRPNTTLWIFNELITHIKFTIKENDPKRLVCERRDGNVIIRIHPENAYEEIGMTDIWSGLDEPKVELCCREEEDGTLALEKVLITEESYYFGTLTWIDSTVGMKRYKPDVDWY